MITELEGSLNTSLANDRQVGGCSRPGTLANPPPAQTLTKVVQELDKTLFDSYIKPKSSVITAIVRGGILDSEMDWYETPQPKGRRRGQLLFLTWLISGC